MKLESTQRAELIGARTSDGDADRERAHLQADEPKDKSQTGLRQRWSRLGKSEPSARMPREAHGFSNRTAGERRWRNMRNPAIQGKLKLNQ